MKSTILNTRNERNEVVFMDSILYDYEQVLIGNREAISQFNFYGANPGGLNQNRALSCIKYILEEILQWNIDLAKKKFDMYMIQLMKMDRLVEYIDFPPEVEFGDGLYILSLIYPEEIKLDQKNMIENVYKNVLDGKGQFPREYFIGQKGFYRFCICLCYLIANYKPFASLDEIYCFLVSKEGRKFLDDYRLKIPMEHLNIDILECVYSLTDDDENSKLYFTYYKYLQSFARMYKTYRKNYHLKPKRKFIKKYFFKNK